MGQAMRGTTLFALVAMAGSALAIDREAVTARELFELRKRLGVPR